jgi:carboxypeptidase D
LSKENGPFHFPGNISTPRYNPYAWTKLANVLYIDQPVGTGFSGGSSPPRNNLEITDQFYQWLKEFYKEFPGLKSKDTFLTGESYAAIYVSAIPHPALTNCLDLVSNKTPR